MATPAATNDCWQVRVQGRMEGQVTENVLHFKTLSDTDDIETRLIVVLLNCFVTHLIPVITSAWQLERIVWKQVTPVLGVEHVYTTGLPAVGAGNAAALPSFNSAVLSLRSLLGGRSHRGRMYICGIPEAATINSAFDTTNAYWTALVNFAACLVTGFVFHDPVGPNHQQLSIYSRKIGGATFPYGLSGFTAVETVNPVTQIGTTRSRKVGRGE
jgi:hypothetical protein